MGGVQAESCPKVALVATAVLRQTRPAHLAIVPYDESQAWVPVKQARQHQPQHVLSSLKREAPADAPNVW